jgi:DNA primase
MKFPRAFLQEIKDRLTLSDVIGQRVALRRAGRELKGCCPFHDEKTPSFTVNDTKQFYHCFGCGAHGDVIGFVMAHDHLPFADAVKMLAGQAGLQLPQQSPQQIQEDRQRQTLYRLMDEAAQWFHERLADPHYRHALKYLVGRGVTAEQIETFRLGYAPPDGRLLRPWLLERGYRNEDMIAAGVMQRSSKTGRAYSPFRDRIIFPVTDRRGRAVAFGGRLLPDHLRSPPGRNQTYAPPKYLNSTETPLFHKGRMLYGEAQARQALGQSRPLTVVEGYTDVLACHRGGFAAVAPLGTALSEDQILLLWQMIPDTTKVPILCFDGDTAGKRAAQNACEKILPLLKPRHSARFAFLPSGEDPDTLIAGQGREAFQAVLDRALPLDQYLWRLHTAGQRFDTPEARAGLEEALHQAAGAIQDDTVRRYYRDALDDKLRRFFAAGSDPRLHKHFTTAIAAEPS